MMNLLDKCTKLYASSVAACRSRHIFPMYNYFTNTYKNTKFNASFTFKSLVIHTFVFIKCRKCLIPNFSHANQTLPLYSPF